MEAKTILSVSNLTIYGARKSNLFSQVDPAFKDLKIIDEVKSPETVDVYELVDDNANFLQAFLSLGNNPTLLGLSEDTVLKYCANNESFLKQEKQNVFFYLGDRVVAKVNYYANDGLHINKYDLHSPIVWEKNRKRFFAVVPSK